MEHNGMPEKKKIIIEKTPNADTRTATIPLTRDILLEGSLAHICHVKNGIAYFKDMLDDSAKKHDWTKIEYIDEFFADAQSGAKGDAFKNLRWFKRHVTTERHHVNDFCHDDINLIDILERVADITMAGMSRSGNVYTDELPADILQRAYKNTILMLKENIETIEPKQ